MTMQRRQLESAALKLDARARARLAHKLLRSLDALTDEEAERLWIEEAERRDAELDADSSKGRPASAVFRRARSSRA